MQGAASHKSQRSARGGQGPTFAGELQDQLRVSSAERGADGEFAPARQPAHQLQVGEIGAGDQEPDPAVASRNSTGRLSLLCNARASGATCALPPASSGAISA